MSISASLGELLGNAQARALPETLSEHILEAAWAIFFVSKSSEDTRTHPAPRLLLFSLQGTTLLPSTGVPGGGTQKPVNPGQLQGKGELPAGLGGRGSDPSCPPTKKSQHGDWKFPLLSDACVHKDELQRGLQLLHAESSNRESRRERPWFGLEGAGRLPIWKCDITLLLSF